MFWIHDVLFYLEMPLSMLHIRLLCANKTSYFLTYRHSEMGPVRQNTIHKTVNFSALLFSKCTYDCAQLCNFSIYPRATDFRLLFEFFLCPRTLLWFRLFFKFLFWCAVNTPVVLITRWQPPQLWKACSLSKRYPHREITQPVSPPIRLSRTITQFSCYAMHTL